MGRYFGVIILLLFLLLVAGCSGTSEDAATPEGLVVKPDPVARSMSGVSPAVNHCDVMVDDSLQAGSCEIYNDGGVMHFVFAANELWDLQRVRIYCDTVPPEGEIEYRTDYEMGSVAPMPYAVGPGISDEPIAIGAGISEGGMLGGTLMPPLPYELVLSEPVSELHLTFNIGGWNLGEPLYIRAEVKAQGRTANVYSSDAPGEEVFEYYPRLQLDLPSEEILTYIGYGDASTYRTTLYSCPDGYDVAANTPYTGWCVDLWHVIHPNQMYNVSLYNSYATDLPERLRDEDWDMVNYVVNHKQGNDNSVQGAIWYFVGGGSYPDGGNAQAMVDDALANGEGFTPGPADTLVVIVDVDEDTQTTAIEIPLWDIFDD